MVITLLAIAALLCVVGATLVVGVALGATAYVIMRTDSRNLLRASDPVARVFYPGRYNSPFSWHRQTSGKQEAA